MASLRKLAGFLRPYWKLVVMGPLLLVVEVAMDLMQPRLTQTIVDEGIAHLDMPLVIRTGLLMVGLAVVGAAGGIGNTFVAVPTAVGVASDLRSALYRRVQSLSFRNLDALGTGSLVTRLTNDVTQVQDALLTLLRIFIRAPLILVGSVIMAVLTCPGLSVLLLALAPFLLVIVTTFFKRAHPMFARVQERLDRLNEVVQENLAGIRVVKAFVRGEHERSRFGAANEALTRETTHAFQFAAAMMPLMMLVMNLGIVAAIWFGGVAVTRGDLRVGQLIAFINYILRTLMSVTMVAMLLVRLSRAGASAARIVEVLDSEPDVRDAAGARVEFAPRGRVAFEHVTFSYDDAAQAALQDVTFEAEPGQMVAILGATGSGKSTLVHLIPRFYDVKSGRVTLDGVDVRDLSQATLRRHIGMALQESVLFSGTISHNIRYGRPEATDDEVVAAARAAEAHDFIAALPDGYETLVGQRGVNLSGGQKQRIAIARALVVRPAVLILDDSTSAVDVETESRIEGALRELMRNATSIVIAQRISTVLNADKILVLDGGRLVAEGTHRELLAESLVYREIYESQLGDGAAVP